MKHCYYALLSLVLAFSFTGFAKSISPEEALSIVCKNSPRKIAGSSQSFRLSHTFAKEGKNTAYIFSKPDEDGFMITAADDAVPVLLGYGDSPIYDDNGELPPAVADWIERVSEQIAYAVNNSIGCNVPRRERPYREPIEPLMTTKWSQTYPYNMYCPEIDGKKCPTGCVATAGAQVMKYFEYPETFSQYNPESGCWTSKYYMSDLLDEYSSYDSADDLSCKAIASFMLIIGHDVKMNYTLSGSSAQTYDLVSAFRYNGTMVYHDRSSFSLSEWENMVYDNLVNCGPVIFDGVTANPASVVGHCFVCDGYAGDGYFHFNWGWGGVCDGYFLLCDLDYDNAYGMSAYRIKQSALFGINPQRVSVDAHNYLCVSENYQFSINTDNNLAVRRAFSYSPVIKLRSLDAENDEAEDIVLTQLERKLWSLADIPEGEYVMTVSHSNPNISLRFGYGYTSEWIVEIGEENSVAPKERIPAEFRDVEFGRYIGKENFVAATGIVSNPNNSHLYTTASLVLLDKETLAEISDSALGIVNAEPNSEEPFDLKLRLTRKDIPDGEYLVAIKSRGIAPGLLCEPQPITVDHTMITGINTLRDTETTASYSEYYTPSGILMARVNSASPTPSLPHGIYIVKTGTKTKKVIL